MIATGTSFSVTHIALTAGLTGLLAAPLAYWLLRHHWTEVVAIAIVTAASVLLWRKSANMGQLNDDGLNSLSANDWLAPVVTYVFLSVYGALRRPADAARFARLKALVTIL